MASICNDPNGQKRIAFVAPDGSRKAIRLGKVDQRGAESVARHVESLLSQKICGQPVTRETAVWLSDLNPKLKIKLASVGLIESDLPEDAPIEDPKKTILGAFLEGYILSRRDVKPATLVIWRQPCRNLKEFFGADKRLADITPGDCKQFKEWLLTQKLAATTKSKRLKFAREFFNVARGHRFIESNPFAGVKVPAGDVSLRKQFVGRDVVARLLAVADPTWRTIIALSRFGGLRCPSEVLSLEWRHVNFETERIQVPSPKTEGYGGKASREIPLFKELRPFLEEAFELAAPGQTHVVGGNHLAKGLGVYGWVSCNLRTHLLRLLKRAGLEKWPRLFHNMRASFETELLEQFAGHVAAAWLGHSAVVMLKHYAQVTGDHFERAAGGKKSGAESGADVAQNPAQQRIAVDCKEMPISNKLNIKSLTVRLFANPCESQVLTAKGFDGGAGNRTPVPKPFHTGVYVRSKLIWQSYSAVFTLVDSNCKATSS